MGRRIEFKSETVDRFLDNFSSESTKRGYRVHLRQFFKECLNKDPDKYIIDVRLLENSERIKILESYENDVKKYNAWLQQKGTFSPKTISNGIDAIKQFFKENKIYLDPNLWTNLKRRGFSKKPIMKETPITPDMLKKLLNHGDCKARTMFLIMSSSGIRIGELVNLRKDDINFESHPTLIDVKYRGPSTVKTKTSRTVFISDEATESLKEWLNYRDKSLKISESRNNLKGKMKIDDRIFPFSTNDVRHIWSKMLEKAKMDKKFRLTGYIHGKPLERYQIHPHGLRKYFRTRLSKHNRDLAEFLMGHEGYLNGVYYQPTDEEIKKDYLEGQKYLTIYENTSKTVEELRKSDKDKDKRINELEEKMEEMKAQITELRLEKLEQLNGIQKKA
jgi:integrase